MKTAPFFSIFSLNPVGHICKSFEILRKSRGLILEKSAYDSHGLVYQQLKQAEIDQICPHIWVAIFKKRAICFFYETLEMN